MPDHHQPPHPVIGHDRLQQLLNADRARYTAPPPALETKTEEAATPAAEPAREPSGPDTVTDNPTTAKLQQPRKRPAAKALTTRALGVILNPDTAQQRKLSPDHRFVRTLRPLQGGAEAEAFRRHVYNLQVDLARATLDNLDQIDILNAQPRVDFILPRALGALLFEVGTLAPRHSNSDPTLLRLLAGRELSQTCRRSTIATAGKPSLYQHETTSPIELGVSLLHSATLTNEIAQLTELFSNHEPRAAFLPLMRFIRSRPSVVIETTLCGIVGRYLLTGSALRLGWPQLVDPPSYEGITLREVKASGSGSRQYRRRIEAQIEQE